MRAILSKYSNGVYFWIFIALIISQSITAQNNIKDKKPDNGILFQNQSMLYPLFNKLYRLESAQQGKINIVHIGDSHIQADFMTHQIRKTLQSKFGNAGYGFTFPYSLAKTNATNIVQYNSNAIWSNYKNISPESNSPIGLSGINIQTSNSPFHINISVKEPYSFNIIKLIYPSKAPLYTLAYLEKEEIKRLEVIPQNSPKTRTRQTKNIVHVVKKKETLWSIASKHNVSVDEIKKANKLKTNNIAVAKKLSIPSIKDEVVVPENLSDPLQPIAYKPSGPYTIEHSPYMTTFSGRKTVNDTYIVPISQKNEYNLSGIVLEKESPGIIYHSIGVNGAKVSDFNKYDLFFDQLGCLSPDMLVVTLGTNESYGNMSNIAYLKSVFNFVSNIKERYPNTVVLFMTPPPSVNKRKKENHSIEEYRSELLDINACVIWDLLNKTGGVRAPFDNDFARNFMAKDKVHFNRNGYEMMANLFTSDLLSAYQNYINSYILNAY